MQRDIFLKMCQNVSVLKNGVCGIKENVPDELTVVYNGMKYYPAAYELSFDDKGGTRHTAILHDLQANGVMHACLEKVEKYEPQRSYLAN